ncbi:MAG: hypothetical protein ABIH23_13430, partial [bacterium]
PDGKTLAIGAHPYRIMIYNLDSGEQIRVLNLPVVYPPKGGGPYRGTVDLSFSPSGDTLLTGDAASRLVLWDFRTGTKIREYDIYRINEGSTIDDLAFLRDGRRVVVDHGAKVDIVDLELGEIVRSFDHSRFRLSRDGTKLLLPYSGGDFELYDLETDRVIWSFPLRCQGTTTNATDLSPDGTMIIGGNCGSSSPRTIWDVETQNVLRTYPSSISQRETTLKFFPDGKRFLSVTWPTESTISIYNISDLQSAVREAPEYERKE